MEYEVLQDSGLDDGPRQGEIWMSFALNDYGLKSDHERFTGQEHINLSRDGKYPFFTVPKSFVREAKP